MKFSEMAYKRPDLGALKAQGADLTARLRAAKDYEEARRVFLENEAMAKMIDTQASLASIRHSINTEDPFYDAEQNFWDASMPEIEEIFQNYTQAMLESKFRGEFEKEYGSLLFVKAEMELKTFSQDIMPELQKENELTSAYEKLTASAQIPFEGKVYTLAQIMPLKQDADDERRLAAWKADGQWFKDNQAELDRIYDELVHVRDTMGRKLGYDGYTQLGYYRMQRNCYTKEDIEKFRAAVVKYLVPVADSIFRSRQNAWARNIP